MRIVGISAFYHDSAAALVEDGEIVAAAHEERFTRKKHDASFPENALKYCLAEAGAELDAINYVAFYDKPFLKFERLLERIPTLAVPPPPQPFQTEPLVQLVDQMIQVFREIMMTRMIGMTNIPKMMIMMVVIVPLLYQITLGVGRPIKRPGLTPIGEPHITITLGTLLSLLSLYHKVIFLS